MIDPRAFKIFSELWPRDKERLVAYLKWLAFSKEPNLVAAYQIVQDLQQAFDQESITYTKRGRPTLDQKKERDFVKTVNRLVKNGNTVTEACKILSKQMKRAPLTLRNRFYRANAR